MILLRDILKTVGGSNRGQRTIPMALAKGSNVIFAGRARNCYCT